LTLAYPGSSALAAVAARIGSERREWELK